MRLGRKPKPTAMKVLQGALHPTIHHKPETSPEPPTEGRPSPPKPLKGRAKFYWDTYIKTCKWLGEFDGQRAYMWCMLAAAFEEDENLNWRMVAQLRGLGSELCLDPTSRARLGVKTVYRAQKGRSKASKYFKTNEDSEAA